MLAACIVFFGVKGANAWIVIGGQAPAGYAAEFNQALTEIRQELLTYQRQPKLARSFASANAYASHASTQRGYQGYKLMAISVGTMAGAQVPSLDFDYYKSFEKIEKELQYKGDVELGLALVPYSVQVGLNLGAFGVEGLYTSVKFGMLNYSYDKYYIEAINTGLMLNYQIVKAKKAGLALFLWRGLSIGTGVLYNKNYVRIGHSLTYRLESVVYVRPELDFNIYSESWVVPLELTTSLRLLWILNLTLGAGIDFATSETFIKVRGISPVYELATFQTGFLYAYGEEKGKMRNWYLPKLIAGVGFGIGPVVIDVPISYYFIKGIHVGVSVGVTF